MNKKFASYGFTLIELLVTISIMAILMGLVVGLSGVARRKSADAKTRAELQAISTALEEYKLLAGAYPSKLDVLTNQNKNISRIEEPLRVKVMVSDPWSRPYVYTNISRYSYILYSLGPLEDVSDDDILVGAVQ